MVTDTKQYVNWFRHSSPYINAYRGKVFVIMLPGEALAHENFHNILHDITLLNSLGVKLVLVHGARPQIDLALLDAKLKTELHDEAEGNLRVTDPDSLVQIKRVVGELRIEIEAMFSMGLVNSPMHGANINICSGNFIIAKPYGVHNGIDYSYTGEVRKVDSAAIDQQLAANNIVLLSNLGYSATGEVFNLTVEEVASATAAALKAEKLIIYGSAAGILNADNNTISKLSADEAKALIAASSTNSEQVKNLKLGLKASLTNVKRAQIISYQEDGALLTELFTRDGSGTLITQENYEEIRNASIEDVGGILELIQPLENNGTLVHRSRELLEAEINQFCVIEREGTVIACGALYPQDGKTAELACIATHSEYRNNNRGQLILERIESNAKEIGVKTLFVLTTKTPHWFIERGFQESNLNDLPDKKKDLYNFQRNSKIFKKQL